jgi:hypothetical protein
MAYHHKCSRCGLPDHECYKVKCETCGAEGWDQQFEMENYEQWFCQPCSHARTAAKVATQQKQPALTRSQKLRAAGFLPRPKCITGIPPWGAVDGKEYNE